MVGWRKGGLAHPSGFELIENTVTSTGVILASYKRAGEVKTGNAEETIK